MTTVRAAARSLGRKLALGIGVVAIAAAGFFAFKAVTGGDGGNDSVEGAGGSTATVDSSSPADVAAAPETAADDDDTLSAGATTDPATSDAPPTTEADATGTTAATTTTAAPAPPAAPPTTAAPAPPPAPTAPYVTLPDGSPAWATAIYDVDKITLTGVVPDDAARQKLEDLARLSAKPGQGDVIDNQLTINPAVPRSVGVRVVELTSARFPEGSADVMPDAGRRAQPPRQHPQRADQRDGPGDRPRRPAR